jgi:hypothetical protein
MSEAPFPLSRRLLAEALGTAILVATVVGSGLEQAMPVVVRSR